MIAYIVAVCWVEDIAYPFNNKKNSEDNEAD